MTVFPRCRHKHFPMKENFHSIDDSGWRMRAKKTFSIADDDDGNVNEDESNIKNVYYNFYIYKKMNKRKVIEKN